MKALDAAKEDRNSICIYGTWNIPYSKGQLYPDADADGTAWI